MSDDKSGGFSWFLAGLGIGSLIGVLYAPKSGVETREELKAGALGRTEYMKQRAREVGSQAGDLVERGKGQVNEYVGRGKEYVDVSRDKINDAVVQGKQLVNEQTQKVAAAYEAGKQAYVQTSVPPGTSEPLS